jgi:hypothetical protein
MGERVMFRPSPEPPIYMHPQLENALWIATPVLQLGVAIVMLWRGMNKTFPVFFAYIVSQIGIFAIIYPIRVTGHYSAYFYSYWICAGITLIIGFMVIHEIFLDIFRPFHTLKDLGSILFKWAGLVMLLMAGVVAAASPASSEGPMVQAILTVQRCVRMIQCGLVIFLLVFSKYLGVSWRHRSFGIAFGFGTFAIVEQLAVALGASSHAREEVMNLVIMFTYNLAIVIWMGYMGVKQMAREDMTVLLTTQRWDQSLNDLQNPGTPDSLIPMFEGMVDRAFSRTKDPVILGDDPELERLLISSGITDPTSACPVNRAYSERAPQKT